MNIEKDERKELMDFLQKEFRSMVEARSELTPPTDKVKCEDCGKLITFGTICKCEVSPKYDQDYEDWKNK
jgi:ribosomal protein L32